MIVSITIFSMLAASGYILIRIPTFASTAQLLIESNELHAFRGDSIVVAPSVDSALIETQVQILSSEGLALQVIGVLRLADHNSFTPTSAQNDPDKKRQAVLTAFVRNLAVARLGLSYVINVKFTSADPAEASQVVNELLAVYEVQQEQAAAKTAEAASAWLQGRLRDISTRGRVLSTARPATLPSSTRSIYIVCGSIIVGLLTGMAFAIILEVLNQSVQNSEDAQEIVKAEFLGYIPKIASSSKLRRTIRSENTNVVNIDCFPEVSSQSSPHWHFIRTLYNIEAAVESVRRSQPLISVGIISALEADGKTTLALNLARLMARRGRRVLLIDANAQRPTLTRLLGLDAQQGLRNLLDGEAQLSDVVCCDDINGFSVLPIGVSHKRPTNDCLFLFDHFDELVGQCEGQYEMVVFDLSPIYPPADVRLAAPLIDWFIMVLSSGRISTEHLNYMLQASGEARSKILGFVINRAALTLTLSKTSFFLRA